MTDRIVLYDTKCIEVDYSKIEYPLLSSGDGSGSISEKRNNNIYLHRGHGGFEFMSHTPIVGLKMVKKESGRLLSLYDGNFEYKLNYSYTQRVSRDHGGGMYLYTTNNLEHFMYAVNNKLLYRDHPLRNVEYAIIECIAYGAFIAYDRDGEMLSNSIYDLQRAKKVACSKLIFNKVRHIFRG